MSLPKASEGTAYYSLHVLLIVATLLFVLIRSGRVRAKMEVAREASSDTCKPTLKPAITPVESRKTRDPQRVAQMG